METVRGGKLSWDETQCAYRQHLYIQGRQKGVDAEGQPVRAGFTPEQVQAVLAAGGQLPMHELLRCRVRYFSDGLALGSRAFLEEVFQQYRGHFGTRRQSGACAMLHGDWGGLCTMRNLRRQPVSCG